MNKNNQRRLYSPSRKRAERRKPSVRHQLLAVMPVRSLFGQMRAPSQILFRFHNRISSDLSLSMDQPALRSPPPTAMRSDPPVASPSRRCDFSGASVARRGGLGGTPRWQLQRKRSETRGLSWCELAPCDPTGRARPSGCPMRASSPAPWRRPICLRARRRSPYGCSRPRSPCRVRRCGPWRIRAGSRRRAATTARPWAPAA